MTRLSLTRLMPHRRCRTADPAPLIPTRRRVWLRTLRQPETTGFSEVPSRALRAEATSSKTITTWRTLEIRDP